MLWHSDNLKSPRSLLFSCRHSHRDCSLPLYFSLVPLNWIIANCQLCLAIIYPSSLAPNGGPCICSTQMSCLAPLSLFFNIYSYERRSVKVLAFWFITWTSEELWKGNIDCKSNKTFQISGVKWQFCLNENEKEGTNVLRTGLL